MLKILRKPHLYFLAAFGVFWLVFVAAIALPFFYLKIPFAEKFYNHFGRSWLWLFDVRLKVKGLENLPERGQGIILAPNHESNFDIFILASLPLKLRWISKEEVAYFPFLGWTMKAMGCYFVKRDKSGNDLRMMKQVEEDLQNGVRIVMFPEGTRTRTGKLLPFKKGAFRTAQNAGVPLLPVAITGTRAVAPAGGVPAGRGFDVTVRFGKPYLVGPGPLPPYMEEYRKILLNLLQEDRGKIYDG